MAKIDERGGLCAWPTFPLRDERRRAIRYNAPEPAFLCCKIVKGDELLCDEHVRMAEHAARGNSKWRER